jgi:hypothetical protein
MPHSSKHITLCIISTSAHLSRCLIAPVDACCIFQESSSRKAFDQKRSDFHESKTRVLEKKTCGRTRKRTYMT